jgi:hypothetical protein
MKKSINKGDIVSWEWGKVQSSGQVIELYSNIAKELPNYIQKSAEMKQALLIQLADGRKVLKLEDEVDLKKQ